MINDHYYSFSIETIELILFCFCFFVSFSIGAVKHKHEEDIARFEAAQSASCLIYRSISSIGVKMVEFSFNCTMIEEECDNNRMYDDYDDVDVNYLLVSERRHQTAKMLMTILIMTIILKAFSMHFEI